MKEKNPSALPKQIVKSKVRSDRIVPVCSKNHQYLGAEVHNSRASPLANWAAVLRNYPDLGNASALEVESKNDAQLIQLAVWFLSGFVLVFVVGIQLHMFPNRE